MPHNRPISFSGCFPKEILRIPARARSGPRDSTFRGAPDAVETHRHAGVMPAFRAHFEVRGLQTRRDGQGLHLRCDLYVGMHVIELATRVVVFDAQPGLAVFRYNLELLADERRPTVLWILCWVDPTTPSNLASLSSTGAVAGSRFWNRCDFRSWPPSSFHQKPALVTGRHGGWRTVESRRLYFNLAQPVVTIRTAAWIAVEVLVHHVRGDLGKDPVKQRHF